MTIYQVKSIKYSTLLLLTFICCLFSCDLVNPEETLPAYLQINQFNFTTTPAQGNSSEQITDAWVFVNDVSLGIYELPATIPTLNLGTINISVFPVIRENGIRNTPIIYPFYQRYETILELSPETTALIAPSTSYVNNAVFELVEDFDKNGHRLNGGNPNAIEVNNGIGVIQLKESETIEFTSSATFLDLPTAGGLAVFLEFDYKTNVELEAGLVGIDPNPTNPVNATSYKVTLCPINRWNKVYINLQEDLEISQLPGYKLAFRASTQDTGCGNLATGTPEVLIDNVKFIRLQN